MIRNLFVWTLLAIMPFSGMRVICIDRPVDVSTGDRDGSSADCERLCAVHHTPSGGDADCSLTADGSSLMLAAGIAVLPVEGAWGPPAVAAYVYAESAPLYLEPGLAHLSPPPKTHIL